MGKIIDTIRRLREPESPAEAELPGVLRRQEMLDRMPEVSPYRIPLGVSAEGVEEWDTERDQHLLVAGLPASGKSVTALGIVSHALSHPAAWSLYACDPRRVELSHLVQYPSVRFAAETEDILAVLREVEAETERRIAEMKATRVGIRGLNPPPKRLLVVVAELAEVLAPEAEATRASLKRIARLGKAAGVHLVLATQRPTEGEHGDITANATSRLACGRMPQAYSEAAVGSEAAAHLPALSGRAIHSSVAGEREIQLALTEPGDLPDWRGETE